MTREQANHKVSKQENKYGQRQETFKQTDSQRDQKRYGPFTIKEEIGQGAYRLELLEGWAIYNVFNKDLLTCCKKAEFASQHKNPPLLPDIINEEEEYEVEEIRGHHKKGRGT